MTHDELVLKVKEVVDDYEHFLNSDPYQLYEMIAELIEEELKSVMKSCKELKCTCLTCAKRPTCGVCQGRILNPGCEGIKLCPDYSKVGMKSLPTSNDDAELTPNGLRRV